MQSLIISNPHNGIMMLVHMLVEELGMYELGVAHGAGELFLVLVHVQVVLLQVVLSTESGRANKTPIAVELVLLTIRIFLPMQPGEMLDQTVFQGEGRVAEMAFERPSLLVHCLIMLG